MELALFVSYEEFSEVSKMIAKVIPDDDIRQIYVEGMSKEPQISTEWYTADLKKYPMDIPFKMFQPDNYGGREFCLSLLGTKSYEELPFKFNDYPCDTESMFLCQTVPNGEKSNISSFHNGDFKDKVVVIIV
jgi:hypothetical protein